MTGWNAASTALCVARRWFLVRASRIEEDTSVQLWKVQQSKGKAEVVQEIGGLWFIHSIML
jgi:hypothetical protein